MKRREWILCCITCLATSVFAQKGALHIHASYLSEWIVVGSRSNSITDPLFNQTERLSGMSIDVSYGITDRSGVYMYASGSMAGSYKFETDGFVQAVQAAYPGQYVSVLDGYRNQPFKLGIFVGGYRRRLGQHTMRPEVSMGAGIAKWRIYKGVVNIKSPDSHRLYNLICDLEPEQLDKTHFVLQAGFACRPVLYKRLYAGIGLQCNMVLPASVRYDIRIHEQVSGESYQENAYYNKPALTMALTIGLGLRI